MKLVELAPMFKPVELSLMLKMVEPHVLVPSAPLDTIPPLPNKIHPHATIYQTESNKYRYVVATVVRPIPVEGGSPIG